MESIERCIYKRALHEQEIQKRLNDKKLQIQECKVQKVKASDASSGDTDSSGFISNNRDAQIGQGSRDDTDIRPSYDTEPMADVDSNTTPASSNMCNDEVEDDQTAIDHKDERVVLANLIEKLKLDIDENKTIQKASFVNPKYLKKAQSEKPCLYKVPYDKDDLKNIFAPNSEETLILEKESRSKLDKDLVKHYDYTYQNSLYELFTPQIQKSLDQMYFAMEIRKKLWRKSFVKYKPNIMKNIGFLPTQASINKPITHEITVLVKDLLMPLADKTRVNASEFEKVLKEEMFDDLQYVQSFEKELDPLQSDKNEFSNEYDLLLQECLTNNIMYVALSSMADIDEYSEMACKYLDKIKECERLEIELSKHTETPSKQDYHKVVKSFYKLEQHSIALEIVLQNSQEQLKMKKFGKNKNQFCFENLMKNTPAQGSNQRAYDRRDSDRYGNDGRYGNRDKDKYGNNRGRNDRHGSDKHGNGSDKWSTSTQRVWRDQDQQVRGQQYSRSYGSSSQRGYSDYASSPPCTICGKLHSRKVCHRATGACFECGEVGHLDKDCKKDNALSLSTPMLNCVIISHEFRNSPLRVGDDIRFANLLPLETSDFDIILGMNWLTDHRATIDCHSKRVIFGDLNNPKFIYHGSRPGKPIKIISALKARTLISHGCEGFLASIKDTSLDGPRLESHPVVRNFPDVFPDELPGLPPEREVELTIELIPGAQPISKASYRMAPIKEAQKEDGELWSVVQNMKKAVLSEAHSSPFFIHPGSTKMYRDLNQNFWWNGMKQDVARFVAKCLTCQQVKIEHQRESGLLQPLDIPTWKWDQISMDFVTGLPRTFKKNDAIWVVVDRLTKSAHFLPIQQGYSVSKLAEIFQQEIVRLHGTPTSIVSDQDLRFTSRFWKGLQNAWGTRLKFSTAFHPQTDGQTEHTIQTLEDMLRSCTLEWSGNWDGYLCLVEFAYNNSWHASIKGALFELLYGRKCRAPICWNEVGKRVIEGPELVKVTNEKVAIAKEKLKEARGVRRFGLKGKLSLRFIGPFDILDRVGKVSYRLALPPQLSYVHNVFYVSLLRGYNYHPYHVVQYPFDKIREDLSFAEEPEAILDRQERVMRKKTIPLAKVLWKNHPEREATWENKEMMRTDYPHFFSRIGAPFELLYGRKCRAPICWNEVGERVIEGSELVKVTNEKVVIAKEKLKESRSRQKSYADRHRRALEFKPGDRVFLKVSPCRGVRRFGLKGKLSSRFIGSFEILDRVGEVSYRLALPPKLSHVHNVFHVSLLRGYNYHPYHVVQYPFDKIREDLSFAEEPEAILDRQERVMRKKTIPLVKVLWKNHPESEATWENEEMMRTDYPHFFSRISTFPFMFRR
nr:putative nucleotidyltransferase, ribonuclease H [Tanacetum cinerariifolium]